MFRPKHIQNKFEDATVVYAFDKGAIATWIAKYIKPHYIKQFVLYKADEMFSRTRSTMWPGISIRRPRSSCCPPPCMTRCWM